MLLTSPLVVTVGLSLTIPLSLIGQIILNSQTSSLLYWVGAVIVLCSFIFINREEVVEEEEQEQQEQEQQEQEQQQHHVAAAVHRPDPVAAAPATEDHPT
jgi:hypothetical protein